MDFDLGKQFNEEVIFKILCIDIIFLSVDFLFFFVR